MKSALLLLALSLATNALADMGSIPFKNSARITEPKQDAIIAWNGKEQLLYLQTTLSASEETKVLEVMPLPSKPTVEASTSGVFKRCAYQLPIERVPAYKGGGGSPFGGDEAFGPAAKVVEVKEIGAHQIKIVQLLDPKRFEAWVHKEFSKPEEKLEIPKRLLKVIGEYAKDGYDWFLFDTIDLKKSKIKKTPLRIRFKTDTLYYPMRITRTETGQTKVALSIFTNILFEKEDCIGIPRTQIDVPAKPRTISGEKISWIDPPIAALLGNPKSAKLRRWVITGRIDQFEKDLLIAHPSKRVKKD